MLHHFRQLLIIVLVASVGQVSAAEFDLLTHINAEVIPRMTLNEEESRLIHKKNNLVVGIYPYDIPPYSMRNIRREYEGLSADYIGLISWQLNLPVKIIQYDTTEELWEALSTGKIDIIPSMTIAPANRQYIYSIPYATDTPIIGINTTTRTTLPETLEKVDVAMVKGYLPLDQVKEVYPEAKFRLYENYQEALSAVAFRQVKAYLGNGYSLSRNYLDNVSIARFSRLKSHGIGFAFSSTNATLLNLVNRAIKVVPESTKNDISRIWQPELENGFYHNSRVTEFSEQEKRWLSNHPEVSVLIYSKDNAAPVSFIDSHGRLRGVLADLLTLISLKTGLHFNVTTADTTDDLILQVNTSRANMFGSMTPSEKRNHQVLFTRPYLRSGFALVTNTKRNDIKTLSDMRGKKLALVNNIGIEAMIRHRYPDVKIVTMGNETQLLKSVASGDVDAAVGILIMTDYQIKANFEGKIKIVSIVGDSPAWLSFGVGLANPELRNILDKVLLSIPPVELENLASRWRPGDFVVADTFWQRYRNELIISSLFGLLIILFSLSWAFYSRLQMTRTSKLRLELKNQLTQLHEIINSMPFPVALRGVHGELIYCNKKYINETGAEDSQGKTIEQIPGYLGVEQASYYHQKLLHAMNTDEFLGEDKYLERFDSSGPIDGVFVYQWFQPFHDNEGNVVGVICGWVDITEREHLLNELKEAKIKAEESNHSKSVFLSTMSHEIRTPLNAIIGMLDIVMKKSKDNIYDYQAIEVAAECAESLVGLIGDILDLSRIENGHIEFNPERVNLGTIINNLLKVFNGLAIEKEIYLEKIFPTEPFNDVYADPLRIKQVISNLLSNAIKFTDHGGVTIRVMQRIEDVSGRVNYKIEVEDTGTGIELNQQAALFKPFSQAENRRSGTGLGLYISRTICQHMNGSLILSSEKGKGTTVFATMSLPSARGAVKNDFSQKESKNLPVFNVLVVDDNAANRLLLAKQLAWLGQHAILASDGFEALKLLDNSNIDVIITDCNMPGMNGYDLTKIIRKNVSSTHNKTWIIGFTADAQSEIEQRCLNSGMNDCLFKPCSINDLSEALQKVTIASDF